MCAEAFSASTDVVAVSIGLISLPGDAQPHENCNMFSTVEMYL